MKHLFYTIRNLIEISLLFFLINFNAQSQVRIDVDNEQTYQTIDGFGATTISLVYGTKDNLTPALREQAINAVYKEVGLNLGNTSFGVFETPRSATDTWGQRKNDDDDPFHINWDGFNWTGLNNMYQKILLPGMNNKFKNFYPANSISMRWEQTWLSDIMKSDYRRFLDECGEHVYAGLKYWRDTLGLNLKYMMLFNEPTSGNGEITGGSTQTITDIIKAVGNRLETEGFGYVKFVVPGEETEQHSYDVARAILADEDARKYVGAIAYHTYPYGSVYSDVNNILKYSGKGNPVQTRIAIRQSLHNLSTQYNVPLWMTEVSHGGVDPRSMNDLRGRAIHIHDEFLYAGASAYFGMNNMWDMISQQGHFGNKNLYSEEGTIALIDNDSSFVTIEGIGYAIGHYARWFKPGSIMLGAGSSDSLVQVSAFRDTSSGKIAFVFINNYDADKIITVNLKNVSITGELDGEQSYENNRWKPFKIQPKSSTQFEVSLPAESVTSCGGQIIYTKVAIENKLISEDIDISPNPAKDFINIKINGNIGKNFRLVIYNELGNRVAVLFDGVLLSENITFNYNCTNLAPGIYFVRLINNGMTSTQAFSIFR